MNRAEPFAPADASLPDGVVPYRRSTVRLLSEIVRDPLLAIPPPSFTSRMVLTRNAGRLRAYLSDPALIHEALVGQADCLQKSEATKRVLGAALGDGLLTADGAAWRWQRQAMAPAFAHDRLLRLAPAMIAAAVATRDTWLAKPPGTVVDIGTSMMDTTFAIIADTMLSGRDAIDSDGLGAALDDVLGASSWMFALALMKAPRWMPFPGRARAVAGTQRLRGTVLAAVARRRAAPSQAGDLLDMLIAAVDPETGRHLGDEAITDNILTFILAGHETTAVALAWTLNLLLHRPDVRDKLLDESDAVLGDDPLQPDHLAKLGYARQVVSEAMRLYPPAPMIVRTVHRAMSVGGVALPARSLIVVPIYALHRHRALWPEPDVFDPERFAPAAVKARHRFAFMPFGAGPRVCIGNTFALLEAVAILTALTRAIDFSGPATMPQPRMRITLRPRDAIRLAVAPRRT